MQSAIVRQSTLILANLIRVDWRGLADSDSAYPNLARFSSLSNNRRLCDSRSMIRCLPGISKRHAQDVPSGQDSPSYGTTDL